MIDYASRAGPTEIEVLAGNDVRKRLHHRPNRGHASSCSVMRVRKRFLAPIVGLVRHLSTKRGSEVERCTEPRLSHDSREESKITKQTTVLSRCTNGVNMMAECCIQEEYGNFNTKILIDFSLP